MTRPTRRDRLRPQPDGVPWPTERWPEAELAHDVDFDRLNATLDRACGDDADPAIDLTLATAVVHRGRLVAERYGPTAGPEETLVSWSMAKSVTHALVGLLVADGRVDPTAAAPVAAWADDARSAITLQHLLEMSSGLRFVEDYVDDQVSDVIEMLFGAGQNDVAGFASSLPLEHEPGSVFDYSSGTTNIVARICGDAIGGGEAGLRAYLDERLFGPLGMTTADPRFDRAGTFIGSSFVYATARDFLRFGYLYLRDGVWDGERILPEGWADHARDPVTVVVDEDDWYGSHWWLWDDRTGAFAAHGYEGQYLAVIPGRDLVVVRLGKTPAERKPEVRAWLDDLIDCFPDSA